MKLPTLFEIELGEPWRLDDKYAGVAVPILRKYPEGRNYVLLEEVDNNVSFMDTGNINQISAKNGTEQNVFVRKGSIVEGKTQTRAFVNSFLLSPLEQLIAEAKCIYSSKGISRGATMTYSKTYTPPTVMSTLTRSQGETWNAVSLFTATLHGGNSSDNWNDLQPLSSLSIISSSVETPRLSSDDLLGTMKESDDIIKNAMKNVPADHVRQIGLAIVDINGVQGFEIFDSPDSWKALSKSVTKNYSEILTRTISDMYEIRIDKVKDKVHEFLNSIINVNGVEVNKNTYKFVMDFYEGEYTLLNDNMIHLIVIKQDKRPTLGGFKPTVTPRQIFRSTYQTYNARIPEDSNDKKIIDYMTTKRGNETLNVLLDNAKTFKELQASTNMSSSTVSKALKDAEELGLIQKVYNGSTKYELTEYGKRLNPKKFRATIG